MKKLIAVIVIFVCVGSALSAQIGMSVGGGALFDLSTGNGVKSTEDKSKITMPNTSIGAFVFFDASYVEADAYFAFGLLDGDMYDNNGKKQSRPSGYKSTQLMQLGFSLLGKYPVYISEAMTVFPLAGVSLNTVLSAKVYDTKDKKYIKDEDFETGDAMQFGILAGAGMDYSLSSNLFIRAEGLFHLRLPNKGMKDLADLGGDNVKATLGIGPQIKIGVGYRF
jgi:opacity protein-like surface antigen